MHHPIYVYSHDSDPAIDSPAFRITRHEAVQRLARGFVCYLSPDAVQLHSPPDYVPQMKHNGMFNEVWQPRFSAHFLVMQMVTDK